VLLSRHSIPPPDQILCFAAEIKTVDRFETPAAVKAREAPGGYPVLLIAPYIARETAKRCREMKLPFMDAAGNTYLEAPWTFVFIAGQPRPKEVPATRRPRALTPAGLRIVFALLARPSLLRGIYRDIAAAAHVALGIIGDILADLGGRGHLTLGALDRPRFLAANRLPDEWVTNYPLILRRKLNARRFAAPDRDWWQKADLTEYRAWWGGEAAAAKLTNYLRPANVTIYVPGNCRNLEIDRWNGPSGASKRQPYMPTLDWSVSGRSAAHPLRVIKVRLRREILHFRAGFSQISQSAFVSSMRYDVGICSILTFVRVTCTY